METSSLRLVPAWACRVCCRLNSKESFWTKPISCKIPMLQFRWQFLKFLLENVGRILALQFKKSYPISTPFFLLMVSRVWMSCQYEALLFCFSKIEKGLDWKSGRICCLHPNGSRHNATSGLWRLHTAREGWDRLSKPSLAQRTYHLDPLLASSRAVQKNIRALPVKWQTTFLQELK